MQTNLKSNKMKRIFLLLCFGIICSIAGFAPEQRTLTIEIKPPIRPYEALMEAQGMVESSNNNNALNRLELAFGKWQIRGIRLKDYNRRTGKHYILTDCYNEKISKEIYLFYATKFHYSQQEAIAKAWNGKGKSNKIYWKAVKKQLDKNKFGNIK